MAKIHDSQLTSQIPLLVGVDEEGGDVVRVSKYTQFSEASPSCHRRKSMQLLRV